MSRRLPILEFLKDDEEEEEDAVERLGMASSVSRLTFSSLRPPSANPASVAIPCFPVGDSFIAAAIMCVVLCCVALRCWC